MCLPRAELFEKSSSLALTLRVNRQLLRNLDERLTLRGKHVLNPTSGARSIDRDGVCQDVVGDTQSSDHEVEPRCPRGSKLSGLVLLDQFDVVQLQRCPTLAMSRTASEAPHELGLIGINSSELRGDPDRVH